MLAKRARDHRRLRGPVPADLRLRRPSAAAGRVRLEPAARVDSLFILGVAFTVLAGTYLAVQYMLALKRTWFLIPLGAGRRRRADPAAAGLAKPTGFATVVLGRPGGRGGARVRDGAAPATNRDPPRPKSPTPAHEFAGSRPRATADDRRDACAERSRRRRATRLEQPRELQPPSHRPISAQRRFDRPAPDAALSGSQARELLDGSSGSSARELRDRLERLGCSGGPSASSSGIRWKSARSVSSVDGVYSAAAGW